MLKLLLYIPGLCGCAEAYTAPRAAGPGPQDSHGLALRGDHPQEAQGLQQAPPSRAAGRPCTSVHWERVH